MERTDAVATAPSRMDTACGATRTAAREPAVEKVGHCRGSDEPDARSNVANRDETHRQHEARERQQIRQASEGAVGGVHFSRMIIHASEGCLGQRQVRARATMGPLL